MLALPIFPCSRPQSIVGASELNFCVRDGNRWTLTAINTNFVDTSFISFASPQAAKLSHSAVSPPRTKSASLGFCSVLLVYLSSGCPENISIILRFSHLSSAFFAASPVSHHEQPNEVVASGNNEQCHTLSNAACRIAPQLLPRTTQCNGRERKR